MNTILYRISLSASLLLMSFLSSNTFSNSSLVDDHGFYLGAEIGSMTADLNSESDIDISESLTNYKFIIGSHIGRWIGLEATIFQSEDFSDNNKRINRGKFWGATIAPKIYTKIGDRGLIYIKPGYSITNLLLDRNGEFLEEDYCCEMYYVSVGGHYALSNNWKLRLSYEHQEGELQNNETTFKAKLDQLSIGMHYQF